MYLHNDPLSLNLTKFGQIAHIFIRPMFGSFMSEIDSARSSQVFELRSFLYKILDLAGIKLLEGNSNQQYLAETPF